MAEPGPITVVDTLVVQAGRMAALETWLADLAAALAEAAGHDGIVTRLDGAGGVVHLVHRFADRRAFDAWLASAPQRALSLAAERFAIGRRQAIGGSRPRFGITTEADAPKWKRIAVSWATVFPLLLATSYAGQALVPDWPRPVTLALSSLAITIVLNLIVFPRLNRRLEPWLLRTGDGAARIPAD